MATDEGVVRETFAKYFYDPSWKKGRPDQMDHWNTWNAAWQAALAHASSASAEECSVDDHVAGDGKLVDARDAARWRKFASMIDPDLRGGYTVYRNIDDRSDQLIYDERDMAEHIDQAIAGRRGEAT